MGEHQEPWSVSTNVEFGDHIATADGRCISMDTPGVRRRVIACVNFCADVETSLLETLTEMTVGLAAQLDGIKLISEQRDHLREALKLAVQQNGHDMLLTGEELRLCEAALAAAGGE